MKRIAALFACIMPLYVVASYTDYHSPLTSRYSTDGRMNFLFSPHHRHEMWRTVWIALAQAQKDAGLFITQEQIDELKRHRTTIDFDKAQAYEKQFKHDVVAHLHTFGDQCPSAQGILHLGATSCLVTDNADVLIMQEALTVIHEKLVRLMQQLANKADRYKHLACLSYTHLQPAQPTTFGKRMTLWLHDFMLDLRDLNATRNTLSLLGTNGATGTQASFLHLFDGDSTKVVYMEERFLQHLKSAKKVAVSGQTYTRKQDVTVLNALTGIAMSAHKFATDMRLLSHMRELEEPHEAQQVGSSAMPYKKNPILCERACSLARYALSLAENASYTAATQWLERTLDDSANRRMMIPEAFFALDGILDVLNHIVEHMVIYPEIIKNNLSHELPFMATESILTACTKKGADRQLMHEYIRQLSNEAIMHIKNGGSNTLLERIIQDPRIPLTRSEIEEVLNSKQFIGRAPEQVDEFLYQVKDVLRQEA